jgi:cytochrome c-type biogenesis protein CcmH/NrfF
MGNPFERGPGKNIEKQIQCPVCDNKSPSKSNCGRCKGKGYIIVKN